MASLTRWVPLVLVLGLAGCLSSVETRTDSSAGIPVETSSSAAESAPSAAPASCVQDERKVRSCLAMCDNRAHAPVMSRCRQCAPGDSLCNADDTCQMMEEQRMEREDKRCRNDCTKLPKGCR